MAIHDVLHIIFIFPIEGQTALLFYIESKIPAAIASKIPMALGNEIFSLRIKMLKNTVTMGYKAVKEVTILALYFCKIKYHSRVPAKPTMVAKSTKNTPLFISSLSGREYATIAKLINMPKRYV